MDIGYPVSFIDYISTLDLEQLRDCRSAINKKILEKLSPTKPITSTTIGEDSPNTIGDYSIPKSISDFVDYKKDFINLGEKDLLSNELKVLNFNKYATSDKVQNKFISTFSEPYIWQSQSGSVVNEANTMDNFPELKSLLQKLNSEYGCNTNCCLVSYFKNGCVNLRLHDDNEASIDSSEPICLVSLGVKRRVEFVDKNQESYKSSVLKLDPADSSIYIMKPGCQQYFKHRVRMNRKIREDRISLSFRCFIPEAERITSPFPSTPLVRPDLGARITDTPFAPVQSSAGSVNVVDKASDQTNEISPIVSVSAPDTQVPNINNAASGYSPFRQKKIV